MHLLGLVGWKNSDEILKKKGKSKDNLPKSRKRIILYDGQHSSLEISKTFLYKIITNYYLVIACYFYVIKWKYVEKYISNQIQPNYDYKFDHLVKLIKLIQYIVLSLHGLFAYV